MRWLRAFKDRRSDEGRQRRSERYGFEVKLRARCSSWPKFAELFSGNISEGGLYVPTGEQAELGETIQLDLHLPDGSALPLTGRVVNVIDPDRAARQGIAPGLGVKLDPPEGEARARFKELLESARAAQPRPEEPLEAEPVLEEAPRPPGSGRPSELRKSAILEIAHAEDARPRPPPERPPPRPPPLPSKPLARHRPGAPIVGIDLGTTNTSVAAVVDGKVTVLARPDGSRASPSIVAFDRDGVTVYVGSEARRRSALDPVRAVVSPTRLLGRKHADPEIQRFLERAPYRSFEGHDGAVMIEIGTERYDVPQLVAHLLRDARDLAEARLGTEVGHAVLSVPITFEDQEVSALRLAAKMAGLEVVAVIDEPSAAALANRFDPGFGGTLGVYDLGGGTFDFSVVDASGGDLRVLGTAGDTWLGGGDVDRVLAEAVARQFYQRHKVDLRHQPLEWQRLLLSCEQAKRQLATSETAVIAVPDVLRTADGMIGLEVSLDRGLLARACAASIQRSLETCDETLELLDLKASDLSAVYLSGGATYLPAVQGAVSGHFGVPIKTGVPPEYAVCLGAAIHAAQIQFQTRQTLQAR